MTTLCLRLLRGTHAAAAAFGHGDGFGDGSGHGGLTTDTSDAGGSPPAHLED